MTAIFRSPFFAMLESYAPHLLAGPEARTATVKAPKLAAGQIAVLGVLGQNDWFADTDYSEIRASVKRALADPQARTIDLLIDSPGGSVLGLPETEQVIQAANRVKPVRAFVTGIAASAAYWLASQAGTITLTPSGEVGSVGVLDLHADISKALDNAGVKLTAVHAGQHKVERAPFTPLSDDAKAEMQRGVDAWYGDFLSATLAASQSDLSGGLSCYLNFGEPAGQTSLHFRDSKVSGSDTLFAGIHKLEPGHTLELSQNGELTLDRYWNFSAEVDSESRPLAYYVQTYLELLEQAVSSHLMSDVPLGMFLSGGLDSSAVAALATKIRGSTIKTFAVGYGSEDSGEALYSELNFARQIANHIGSDHHEVRLSRGEFFELLPNLIWHEDEPIAWPSSVALFSVAQLAREHVKVVLTGEGSDETLAGYTRYAWTLLNARMDARYRSVTTSGVRNSIRKLLEHVPVGASLHRKIKHTFVSRNGTSWPSIYFDNFFSAFSAADQAELLTPKASASAGDAYRNSMEAWERSGGDLLHRMLHTDIDTYLVELLMKQDQMSMAASIESRVPFVDHELVEFAMRIPTQYSVRGMAGKFILKKAMENILPGSVVYRKKMGFPTPWQHWLAGATLDTLERMLLASRTMDRGLFQKQQVQRIIAEHRNRARDQSNRIWRLLNLEIWQRIFLDGEVPSQIRWGN